MENETVRWSELLHRAISDPGVIASAYSRFHNYSIGNQILALIQCKGRGIEPGPIGTFMRWKDCGRYVRKGEKALMLCMPITCKRKATDAEDDTPEVFTRFTYKRNWFVLSQTEGDEYTPEPLPDWSGSKALESLSIERVAFDMLDGNTQGYAQGRKVAVSPIAQFPAKTLLHELAHVLLGHTSELMSDTSERTPKDIRELEAECVAMLCCASLGLPGEEFSRGYIQHWFHGQAVPERSAQKIFHAADQILKAGRAK
ncbi:MAG TPA: ArdC-like ssDNA-binding domain-containing protein [Bryobacteraceae bacterium]|jgi:antirestriction protein ArdC|nr:ArdC-like ssDNA-binding domain-containing protein [Bryobacteraceae bacterium]